MESIDAFLLADEGYDVWMMNARGNEYSRNHTILNPDADSQFWDFSWHEIGVYDLRATVDYILDETNKTALYHVGYSQGSAIVHILLSTLPDYNNKIKAFVDLGPAIFLKNLKSPLFKIPARILSILESWIPHTASKELSSSKSFLHWLQDAICAEGVGTSLCENVLYILAGSSHPRMNTTLVPRFSQHVFVGASLKQFVHALQLINSGHFRQYDNGRSVNLLRYGSLTPPVYNLSKVTSPGYIMYSVSDLMIDPEVDIPMLCGSLGNCVEKYLIPKEKFNHFDFFIGNDAATTIYANLIRFISQH